jgi:hypothetical protein
MTTSSVTSTPIPDNRPVLIVGLWVPSILALGGLSGGRTRG